MWRDGGGSIATTTKDARADTRTTRGENEATPSKNLLKHLPDFKTAINIKQTTTKTPDQPPQWRVCSSVRMRRTAARKLLQHLPGPPMFVFDPKKGPNIKNHKQ